MTLRLDPVFDSEILEFAQRHDDDPLTPEPEFPKAFVAYVGDQEVGFISYTISGREALITQLYVVPELRNNGLATEIINTIFADGFDFVRVISTVWTQDFYKKLGFFEDQGHTILVKPLIK